MTSAILSEDGCPILAETNESLGPFPTAILQEASGDGVTVQNADSSAFGSNYVICQRTGFRMKAKRGLQKEWNGVLVREDSYSPRQAQDFVRSKAENLPGAKRPEQTDRFVDDEYPNGVQASDL